MGKSEAGSGKYHPIEEREIFNTTVFSGRPLLSFRFSNIFCHIPYHLLDILHQSMTFYFSFSPFPFLDITYRNGFSFVILPFPRPFFFSSMYVESLYSFYRVPFVHKIKHFEFEEFIERDIVFMPCNCVLDRDNILHLVLVLLVIHAAKIKINSER